MFHIKLNLAFLVVILFRLFNTQGYNGQFREAEFMDSNPRAIKAEIEGGDTAITGKTEAIEQTLALLQDGDKNIIMTEKSHIFLIIGNTGAGKSTMTQFLVGDNTKLEAYRPLNRRTILIRDSQKSSISTSTTVSKTIFPELEIDEENNIAFYDCPGFSDTRNTTIEIVNAFFMKKVSSGEKQVKILLVVNHNSLIPGENRKDFMSLIKHATVFLKNMKVFLPAISLLATKLRSSDPDEDIIQEMGDFIVDALAERINDKDNPSSDGMIKLLEALTETNEENEYTRLTFFRQPNKPGPLSQMKLVQEQKLHILNVLHKNTVFASTTGEDYGISLSDTAKNDIRNLTDILTKAISTNMEKVGTELRSYLEEILESNSDLNLERFGSLTEKLNNFFSHLQNDEIITNPQIKFKDFFTILLLKAYEFTGKVDFDFPQDPIIYSIINNAGFLDFFNGISKTDNSQPAFEIMHVQHWLKPLKEFQDFTKMQLKSSYRNVLESFLFSLQETGSYLIKYYDESMAEIKKQKSSDILQNSDSFSLEKLDPLLQYFFHTKLFFRNQTKIQNNPVQFSTFTQNYMKLLNFLADLKFPLELSNEQEELFKKADYLDYFQNLQVKIPLSFQLELSPVYPTQIVEILNQFISSTEPNFISFYKQISKTFLESTTQEIVNLVQSYEEYIENSERLHQEDFKILLNNSLSCFSKIQITYNAFKDSDRINSISAIDFITEFLVHVHCLQPGSSLILNGKNHLLNKARILDLFARIANITEEDPHSLFYSPKPSLSPTFAKIQSALLTLQNNQFKTLKDIINTRILNAVKDLSKKLQLHYKQKLEKISEIDFLPLAQMDSNHFNKTLMNIYQNQGETTTTKSEQEDETNENFLNKILTKFLSPLDENHNKKGKEMKSSVLMKEILKESTFLDFFQSQNLMGINPQNQGYRLKWFYPLQTFSSLLHEILFDPITCGYEPGPGYIYNMPKDIIIAKGTFVSFEKAMAKCFPSNILKTKRTILVMAKNTIFLDYNFTSSLYAMNEYNIGIISPNWIITPAEVEINMDGREGQLHTLPKASNEADGSGSIGLPGFPGENGGSFLGVGMNILGGRFKVTANGGMGSKGQEGGDGSNGSNGVVVYLHKVNYKELKREQSPTGYYARVNIISSPYTHTNVQHGCRHKTDPMPELPIYACVDMTFSGGEGQDGSNGGHGGQGGLGGHEGIINTFFPQTFSNSFKILKESGSMGSSGRGGREGSGGSHGNVVRARFEPTKPRDNRLRIITLEEPWGSHAKNGNPGLENYNANGREQPTLASYDQTLALHSSYIRIFQSFMRQNSLSEDPFHKNVVTNFMEYINNKVSIYPPKSLKNLKNLMDDFEDLDTESLWLKDKINFLPFFHQFRLKLNALSETENASEVDSATFKTVITYLSTAAFGRAHNLNPNYDTNLILNMASYLEISIEQIKTFDQKSYQSSALSLTTKIRQDYNNQIQIKFQEADNFIQMDVIPEIGKIQQHLDKKVNELLKEIEEAKQEEMKIVKQLQDLNEIIKKNKDGLREQSDDEKEKEMMEKLLETKRNLLRRKEKDLKAQNILTKIGQIGGKILSFLGLTGSMVGRVFQKVLSFGQSKIGHSSPQEISAIKNSILAETFTASSAKLLKLSLLLQDTKSKLMDMDSNNLESITTFKNLIIFINQLILHVNTEISRLSTLSQTQDITGGKEPPSSITSATNAFIKEKIANLKHQLALTQTDIISTENFNPITIAKANQNEVKNTQIQAKKHEKLELLRNIQTLLEIPLDTYDKVRESQARIDAISKDLKNSNSKISKLEAFALEVETNMTLMLNESFSQLSNVQRYLSLENGERSGSDLVVTRWKTVSYLRDMKFVLMSQFTRDFKVNIEFSRFFEKLEDAFTTLIQIYERMNTFQEQSRLGQFIANINSIPFQNSEIAHPELREKFEKFEALIFFNTLISQYKIIFNSFKMASFPFADYYLRGVTLQLYNLEQPLGGYARDSSTFVEETSHVLQEIKSKLIQMKSSHNELDTFFHKSPFYSSQSTSPFYTWKRQDGDLVQELLQGNRVYLKADILNSPFGKDAIKFSRVDLQFKFVSTKEGVEKTDDEVAVAATKELEGELAHFKVHMTHMGNSYYRYEDKYYLITTSQVTFIFGFDKDPSGSAMLRNGAYDKVMSGDILLSPYTMWQMYLEPCKSNERDFTQLANLMEKGIGAQGFDLQLELIGNGTYVDPGHGSVLNVNAYYYESDDTMHFD